MEEDTVVELPRPGGTVEDDPLLAVLREGARQMLSLAIEAEVADFLAVHADWVNQTRRRRHLLLKVGSGFSGGTSAQVV